VMSKRDIIELYLNVIEYGPGVYGIRNAARHYFNRLPSDLSPAEAVYLSTILPNPKGYHSHFDKGAPPAGWFDRMRKIFARMRERGWYSPEAVAYGLAELSSFHFVHEGTPTQARDIPGGTAPFPDAPDVFDETDIFGDDGPSYDAMDSASTTSIATANALMARSRSRCVHASESRIGMASRKRCLTSDRSATSTGATV